MLVNSKMSKHRRPFSTVIVFRVDIFTINFLVKARKAEVVNFWIPRISLHFHFPNSFTRETFAGNISGREPGRAEFPREIFQSNDARFDV